MATLPWTQFATAATIALAVAGAALVGPAPQGNSTAAAPCGIAADDPGQPPAPDPAPDTHGPVGQEPPQPAPRPHRRHIDSDPVMRK
jgi:hypothetical protein